VHESGHATMAVIQKRHCEGIFILLKGKEEFWRTLTENIGLTKETYLIAAAGLAAEPLVFGKAVSDPIGDKQDFLLPGAPSWDATVAEAQSLLAPHIDAIRRIAAAAQRVYETTPPASLPEMTIDGVPQRRVLSTEDINRAFHGCDSTPPAAPASTEPAGP
jgi:hypothetical protein